MDTGSTDLRQRDLFGGAMTMKIPSRLTDVSDFRPVPDNQEVFADGDTDQSIIIEIMEASSQTASPGNAAEFYYRDLAEAMEAEELTQDFSQQLSHADIPAMPQNATMSLAVGKQGVAKGRQSKDASNIILVALVAIQLPDVKSDVVLTLYTPLFINPKSAAAEHTGSGVASGEAQAEALQLLRSVIKTLSVKDWGLFG